MARSKNRERPRLFLARVTARRLMCVWAAFRLHQHSRK